MPNRGLDEQGQAPRERFTGHEQEGEQDDAVYYAGARYYDALIARWNSVDPVADDYPGWSPYNYALNNPVLLFDPEGLYPTCGNNCDEYYEQGSVVENQYGSWTYQGNNQWLDANGNTVSGADLLNTFSNAIAIADAVNALGEGSGGLTAGGVMLGAMAISGALVADDATVIGIADDPAITFVLGGAALLAGGIAAYDALTSREQSELRIALGVDEYLNDFAFKVNALPYSKWGAFIPSETTPEAYRAAVIALGMQENTTFHFNLSTPRGRLDTPANLQAYRGSITTTEYQTVRSLFNNKTTYYVRSGSIYKPTF